MTHPERQLERLRWPEVRERLDQGWTTVVFACGAVEQHGPHLPLFMDAEHGTRLAMEIAQRMGMALVAPTIRVGCSEHHMAFAGTISLRQETFEALVMDYVTSLARHGFERILIIPSHGGNFAPLAALLDRRSALVEGVKVQAYTDMIGLLKVWRAVAEEATGLGNRVGGHADLAETSIMLSLHPDLVRTDLAEAGFDAELSEEVFARIIRDGLDAVTPNGILGDARGASATLGDTLIAALVDVIVASFRDV